MAKSSIINLAYSSSGALTTIIGLVVLMLYYTYIPNDLLFSSAPLTAVVLVGSVVLLNTATSIGIHHTLANKINCPKSPVTFNEAVLLGVAGVLPAIFYSPMMFADSGLLILGGGLLSFIFVIALSQIPGEIVGDRGLQNPSEM